jgi:hypothetical protein
VTWLFVPGVRGHLTGAASMMNRRIGEGRAMINWRIREGRSGSHQFWSSHRFWSYSNKGKTSNQKTKADSKFQDKRRKQIRSSSSCQNLTFDDPNEQRLGKANTACISIPDTASSLCSLRCRSNFDQHPHSRHSIITLHLALPSGFR